MLPTCVPCHGASARLRPAELLCCAVSRHPSRGVSCMSDPVGNQRAGMSAEKSSQRRAFPMQDRVVRASSRLLARQDGCTAIRCRTQHHRRPTYARTGDCRERRGGRRSGSVETRKHQEYLLSTRWIEKQLRRSNATCLRSLYLSECCYCDTPKMPPCICSLANDVVDPNVITHSNSPSPPRPPVKPFIRLPNRSSSLARLTSDFLLPLSLFLTLPLPRVVRPLALSTPFACSWGGVSFALFFGSTVISNGLSSSADEAVPER